ncbi:putative bifunctional diguanylate cyclase/phosphodiesterase [Afifella sp. YEN Y35]|uniref:putative bifunctional diguanylate cyclase/phosphodiesterase n=1 Tax=Afifella sp. YEN Y35 TaxID=3388337 RepID=UPI0039E00E2D
MGAIRKAKALSTHVLWVMSLFALLAVGGMLFVVLQALVGTDHVSIERQQQLVRHAMEAQTTRVSEEQKSVTWWDEAVEAAKNRDMPWIHENLGEWMYEFFGHDRTLVVAPDDRAIYAMEEGRAADLETAADVLPIMGPELASLHRRFAEVEGRDAVVERSVKMVGGRPAIISLLPLLPYSEALRVTPGEEYVLVSVQFIDRAFLDHIRDGYLLAKARIQADEPEKFNETSLPVLDDKGNTLAYLAWEPDLPGREILNQVLPTAVIAGLAMLALIVFYARNIYRSSAEIEAGRLRALHLASHDGLTGLPNRSGVIQRLERILPLAGEESIALLFADLDRFKEVNDTYGHPAGDDVIRQFATRVTRLLGEKDMLGRLGGDEFAILIRNLGTREDISVICERILSCASAPFSIEGGTAHVGVSIGYTFLHPDMPRSESLRRADIALYAAKREGRDRFVAFSQEMDAALRARHLIEEELAATLARGGRDLVLHYQPQVSGRDGEICGVEALLRWRHPRLGFLLPGAFIGLAEDTRLVAKLDEWVLRHACRQARDWPELTVAVNISPCSFERLGLAGRLLRIMREERVNPNQIEIEITESVLLKEGKSAAEELLHLRSHGVRVALDDFGTGYSSLNRLRMLKVDKVKIDRSFVQPIGETADSTAIVDAIVELGHALGLLVTAEGVETERQREYLRFIGCDEIQGFLFSGPVPPEAINDMLIEERQRGAA